MIGAAGVLIFGTAPAALAGVDSSARVCDSYCPAGTVNWHNVGDTLQVCDNAPDGYAVAGEAIRPSGGTIRLWDPHGAGTCVSVAYNFSEGYTIPIRACIGVASTDTIVACGAWNYDGVT
ncbi:MAG: hypothetical protein ACJ74U_16095 [Jatrophihabitantaceae bacterium]